MSVVTSIHSASPFGCGMSSFRRISPYCGGAIVAGDVTETEADVFWMLVVVCVPVVDDVVVVTVVAATSNSVTVDEDSVTRSIGSGSVEETTMLSIVGVVDDASGSGGGTISVEEVNVTSVDVVFSGTMRTSVLELAVLSTIFTVDEVDKTGGGGGGVTFVVGSSIVQPSHTPGVPRSGRPGSKPADVVALIQLSFRRIMLVLKVEPLAPAGGVPPVPATSTSTPFGSTSAMRKVEFESDTVVVTTCAVAARTLFGSSAA